MQRAGPETRAPVGVDDSSGPSIGVRSEFFRGLRAVEVGDDAIVKQDCQGKSPIPVSSSRETGRCSVPGCSTVGGTSAEPMRSCSAREAASASSACRFHAS